MACNDLTYIASLTIWISQTLVLHFRFFVLPIFIVIGSLLKKINNMCVNKWRMYDSRVTYIIFKLP